MSGTLESLAGLGDDASSLGSDSEVNGLAYRRTDKYGFLGGSQFGETGERELKVEVARQRELKWLDMFNNWDKWVFRRFQKVKLRCRKGIPSSLRAKAWQLLSNSKELMEQNQEKFEALEREPGDPKWLDIIEKDLHRQFPFHEMFAARGGHGQQDLYRILKAYTVYRPEEGYCQAQAPVAAVLLMHMPAEQAFWCLVQICEKYLPGYYSAGLEAIQLDGEIFFSLLRRVCPMAYRHLKKFKIDPILYMTEWFMCVFSRTLPWACVLRVWDMFFCEGVKIVFRVGLVLLRQTLGSVDRLRECQGMYETMERLRNINPESVREDLLVQEVHAHWTHCAHTLDTLHTYIHTHTHTGHTAHAHTALMHTLDTLRTHTHTHWTHCTRTHCTHAHTGHTAHTYCTHWTHCTHYTMDTLHTHTGHTAHTYAAHTYAAHTGHTTHTHWTHCTHTLDTVYMYSIDLSGLQQFFVHKSIFLMKLHCAPG
ncbi:TB10B protein, partial [Amia calva]|nr:TB10B protein [Amia calva]